MAPKGVQRTLLGAGTEVAAGIAAATTTRPRVPAASAERTALVVPGAMCANAGRTASSAVAVAATRISYQAAPAVAFHVICADVSLRGTTAGVTSAYPCGGAAPVSAACQVRAAGDRHPGRARDARNLANHPNGRLQPVPVCIPMPGQPRRRARRREGTDSLHASRDALSVQNLCLRTSMGAHRVS